MTDLERAKALLPGYSVAFVKGERSLVLDGRGVTPLLGVIAGGEDVSGASAADLIVGKAAAMLMTLLGVKSVYGEVMSAAGREYLTAHGITAEYGTLTDFIRNRDGSGQCPMELAVKDISDPSVGLDAIKARLEQLRKEKQKG